MRRKSKVGVRWTPCRSSNGMLPRLIVLASPASFSFNRDHYSPGEHPPTCRFGRKCMERGCIHATTFSSALDGALTYTNGCLTYLGHACLRLWMYGVRHGAFVCRERTRFRGSFNCSGDQLTNVRTYECMHVSLCSVYRYKLIASASPRRSMQLRVEKTTEDARSPACHLEVHHDEAKRASNRYYRCVIIRDNE